MFTVLSVQTQMKHQHKKKTQDYQICTRCVYDTTIPDIRFDERGICQFCKIHDEMEELYPLGEIARERLSRIISKIKATGKNRRYDCVVGVSGGTDSTYTLYKTIELGLRPLAVHFDNGWNSELSVANIHNAIQKLNVDLETIVADWEEFKDLQISFLKASVSDAEIPTDVAIHTVLHDVAAKENIKYILLGHSFRTEGIVPKEWTYMDGRYIDSVHKRFGKTKITSFPIITLSKMIDYSYVKHINVIPLLNFFDYDKREAGLLLEKELGWTYYGGHHHESIYTQFFQSYYLPRKFNIDKRKLGFSARIRSGKMNREDALRQLNAEPYPLNMDVVDYTMHKLDLSPGDMEEIMNAEVRSFRNYPTYYPLLRLFRFPIYMGFKLGLVPKILYFKYLY
jgi:N-acetyl sugar amidotransferase